jgi:hypothetical protein
VAAQKAGGANTGHDEPKIITKENKMLREVEN